VLYRTLREFRAYMQETEREMHLTDKLDTKQTGKKSIRTRETMYVKRNT